MAAILIDSKVDMPVSLPDAYAREKEKIMGTQLKFTPDQKRLGKPSHSPSTPLPEQAIQQATAGTSLVQRVHYAPRALSHAQTLFLQRTLGNHAVTQLLQQSVRPPLQCQADKQGVPLDPAAESARVKGNSTGLPDTLKTGIEALSGVSLDDVHVYYSSSQPAQIQALAYTQGTTIHVGPGQEEHVPHEAWHVVQQKQGRVQPNLWLKGTAINDEHGLEREADVMGKRALSLGTHHDAKGIEADARPHTSLSSAVMPVQRKPTNAVYEKTVANIIFELREADYLRHLEQSASRPMAFVVNAILPYTQLGQLPAVVENILAKLGNFEGRVGFVFGVNAPETEAQQLDESLHRAHELINSIGVPIALVRSTFRGKFPYGAMRNAVMHSPETTTLLRAFAASNLHPYLSIQDFDTGPRTVPSGQHIFNYLEERLRAGESEEEQFPAQRPLLMTGGYRPGPDLIASTRERFTKGGGKLPAVLKKAKQSEEFVAEFTALISEDMQARDTLARIHPLLPYAPEPNLFIDALPLLLGREDIRFGEGAAEFTHLAKSLNEFLAYELNLYFSTLYHAAPHSRNVPKLVFELRKEFEGVELPKEFVPPAKREREEIAAGESFAQEGEVNFTPLDQEEIRALFEIHAQTGRHPLRGLSFFTDFSSGSIITDLSRLAHNYLKKKKALQSHTQLTHVVDRYFENKQSKKGASFAKYRKGYRSHPYARREPLGLKGPGVQGELSSNDTSMLGASKQNKLSRALSVPLSGKSPFKGSFVGIPEAHKVLSAHAVATSTPAEMMFRLLSFLQQQLGSIGGTPLDGNCLYHAVNQLMGGGTTLEEAQGLRDRVVAWMLHESNLGRVANLAAQAGVDFVDLIHTVARNGNWGGPAGDLAPQLVASTLGITIVIQQAAGPKHSITPLGGPSRQTITIYLHQNHYSVNAPFLLGRQKK